MTEAEWEQCCLPHKLVRNLPDASDSLRKRRFVLCAVFRAITTAIATTRELVEQVERFADGEIADGEIDLMAVDSVREYAQAQVDQLAFSAPPRNERNYALPSFHILSAASKEGLSLYWLETQLFHVFCDGNGDLASHDCAIVRDIFGNPFRPISFSPEWRTTTTVAIAQSMYESRDFAPMPLLADALQDAGCEVPEIIDHCRGPGPHVRGCWVVDGVLGKA